ncbi:MAG: hypothetical protein M0Z28_18310 [Rhodospirillales bacterium]|nr:hypothetical protein [Rhodospirillales bacterium]
MSDEPSNRKPWSIRDCPVSTSETAVECARRQGQTVAEWVTRAVKLLSDMESGERVIPPDERPSDGARQAVIPMETAEIALAAEALARLQTEGIPRDVRRHAAALIRDRMRAARGMPPVKRRQTRALIGQTEAGADG